MGAHPLAPGGDGDGELLLIKLGHRRRVLRRVDQHLVRALCRARGEEVGFAGAFGGEERIAAARERAGVGRRPSKLWFLLHVIGVKGTTRCVRIAERWIEVRDDARLPAWAVRVATLGSQRVELRRRALLAALAEGAVR